MVPKPLVADVNDQQELFPISVVSEATGVPAVTLRAWERRYNFLEPLRTAKGHRLYNVEHIALIRRVTALLDSGVQVSRVADLLALENQPTSEFAPETSWTLLREQMLESIQAFDEARLDQLYNKSLAIFPMSLVTQELIVPLLHQLGSSWQKSKIGVAEEHFFGLYIRNKLGSRWHHSLPVSGGQRIVAACMPGERHEYGLLLFALVARSRGIDPILLGGDMPLLEIHRAVEKTRASAVVISTTIQPGWQVIERDLRQLVAKVDCPVFVGGAGSVASEQAVEATGARPLGADIIAGVEAIYLSLHRGRSEKA